MSSIEKLNFLCTNDEVLHLFLKISYYLNKDPLCDEGDLHSCNGLYDNECEKIKFLLPIMEEMKKGDISNDKKKGFFVFQALKFSCIFEQLFSVYSVILIIVQSREI